MSRHMKKIRNIILKKGYDKEELDRIKNEIIVNKKSGILAIYNPECIGIMNATKDLFENSVAIGEIFSSKMANEISDSIIENDIMQVVFASNCLGWKELVEILKNKKPEIKIKFTWHGSHSMFVQRDESYFLYMILELLDRGLVDSIGFAKESMAIYYKQKGYNSYFLPNTVKNIKSEFKNDDISSNDNIKIGLYSAGNRWEKNTFNQLSAISMLSNVEVDIVPVTPLVKDFCKMMKIRMKDENSKYLKREVLYSRMSQNDMNLYVTFTESSPVTPLESFELGVPCLTGNNHHYFRRSKLEDYLIVRAEDDINEIYSKINNILKKKTEIMKLYKIWKTDYDKKVEEYFKDFCRS